MTRHSSTRARSSCTTFLDALILTHVEFDHADIYRDLDAVKIAFKRLVNLVPGRGRVVAFDGNENVTECVSARFLHGGALWVCRGLDVAAGRI